jgi:PIN domain
VTVVIDANALVALIASEPNGPAVSELIERWIAEERELHAPALARYEVANVLTRQHAAGRLSKEDIKSGWQALEELPIGVRGLGDAPEVRWWNRPVSEGYSWDSPERRCPLRIRVRFLPRFGRHDRNPPAAGRVETPRKHLVEDASCQRTLVFMVPQRIVPVTDKPQREPDHEQKDRSGVADQREVQRGKRGNNQSCGT